MKITDIFTLPDKTKVISGESLWTDNISYKIGDIVQVNNRQWKVVDVENIFQGCFSTPTYRMHSIKLEPLGHERMPAIGSTLEKV